MECTLLGRPPRPLDANREATLAVDDEHVKVCSTTERASSARACRRRGRCSRLAKDAALAILGQVAAACRDGRTTGVVRLFVPENSVLCIKISRINGSASAEMMCPLGPADSAATIVLRPMFAPSSSTLSPSRTAWRMRPCSTISDDQPLPFWACLRPECAVWMS